MAPSDSTAVKELQELRKGRGLATDDLRGRVGPRLRRLCGITDADPAFTVRRAVILKLTELCEELDEDRKLAARVALNLHPSAHGSTLEDRVAWLAASLGRDPKTAIRRVDSAFRMLAELIDEMTRDGASPFAPSGWYNHTIRTTLFVDRDVPVIREERRIIATVDGVRDIDFYFSAPRPADYNGPHRIEAAVLYGGELVAEDRAATEYAKFTVRLPHTLNLGDPHDYSVEASSYPREYMSPYYEMAPLLPVAHFYLRVKFDPANPPQTVWRVDGVPRFASADSATPREQLDPDRLGEIATEFHGLKPNLSYGVHWQQ
ncbi:hypothetical protein [Actinokineospora spheciospongiae]|uniref:hypothetical protein n=1 Tax=Actinokineospora spheciospongiae TaxID=909613 RepID=UPI000D97A3D3|nr:hypothetical protein [Actinokineospora spheciospongiae]PWW53671.1 hypothetical protein DFQ13_11554 [Actinokineospora spheciospongiae]